MKTIKFLTNIPNTESLEKVKSHMNNVNGIIEWNVDLGVPGKILTAKIDGITGDQVANTIFKAGFRSEEIVPGWKKLFKKTLTRDCCT